MKSTFKTSAPGLFRSPSSSGAIGIDILVVEFVHEEERATYVTCHLLHA